MVKNVIFDFGQVLVHFEPEYMTAQYIEDENDVGFAKEIIFDRLYWDRLDAGTISDAEVVDAVLKRLPERLHSDAEKVYYNWIYNIPEIDGMRNLIHSIREKYGLKIYLLSNISRYFASHAEDIPILKEFDGCVFSSVCGFSKPDAEIFEHLCEKFGILPQETAFVDDNADNVRAAERLGIRSFCFKKDVSALSKWFDELIR